MVGTLEDYMFDPRGRLSEEEDIFYHSPHPLIKNNIFFWIFDTTITQGVLALNSHDILNCDYE